MQENEFEKQVRDRLDQLKLAPSDEVWLQVQEKIRARKRRKGLLWIPLAAAMMIGAAAWWAMKEPETGAVTTAELIGNEPAGSTAGDPSLEENTSGTTSLVEKNTSSSGIQEHEKAASSSRPSGISSSEKITGNPRNLAAFPASESKIAEKISERRADHSSYGMKVSSPENDLNAKALVKVPEVSDQQESEISEPFISSTQPLSASVQTELIATGLAGYSALPPLNPSLASNVSASRVSVPRKNKWTFSVDAAGGSSWQVYNGPARFEPVMMVSNAIPLAPPMQMMRPPMAGFANPAPVPVPMEATQMPALAYSVGARVGRSWNDQYHISAGLRYTQLRTQYQIGEYRDQASRVSQNGNNLAVRAYYQNGSKNDYLTRHHFVELPLEFGYTFNPNARFPVIANIGGAVGYLVQTNALHFSETDGVYFKDMALNNRTHFSVQSGVSVRLLKMKSAFMNAGPVFRYHLTNNRDETRFNRESMSFAGLQLSFGLTR